MKTSSLGKSSSGMNVIVLHLITSEIGRFRPLASMEVFGALQFIAHSCSVIFVCRHANDIRDEKEPLDAQLKANTTIIVYPKKKIQAWKPMGHLLRH